MVEVWLPYGDMEIPILLPDPINLKIMPKTIYPMRRELDTLEKLRSILVDITPLNIFLSPLADEAEKGYVLSVLRRLEVDYKIVDDYEESNIVIDIFRYDPILGFRSSVWVGEIAMDPLKFLRTALYKEFSPGIRGGDKLYIDLILDGGARLFDVISSDDGSHYEEAKKIYVEGWCLKTDLAPLIITSLGGVPWDSSLYLLMIGLSKLAFLGVRDSTILIISRTRLRDVDPTIFKGLTIENARDVYQLYIAYCRDKLEGLNIVHYGALPRTIASHLKITKTLNVEKYLSRIPLAMKRDVLVIEDLYLFHPYRCSIPEAGEEA